MAAKPAHIRPDGHAVVIQNDDHRLAGGTGIIKPFKAEAAGHGSVADKRQNIVVLPQQRSGVRHAQSHRHGIGGVARHKGIVHAFIRLRKAGKTAQLPQSVKKRLPAG